MAAKACCGCRRVTFVWADTLGESWAIKDTEDGDP